MFFAENHFFYTRRKKFLNLLRGALMMTAFAVSMSVSMRELRKSSWIVPVDAESCFNSKGGDEETKSEWESAEKHFHKTVAVCSVLWVESPDFISKRQNGNLMVTDKHHFSLMLYLNQGSFKPCRAKACSTSINFGTVASTL